jgi:hypothetical protein
MIIHLHAFCRDRSLKSCFKTSGPTCPGTGPAASVLGPLCPGYFSVQVNLSVTLSSWWSRAYGCGSCCQCGCTRRNNLTWQLELEGPAAQAAGYLRQGGCVASAPRRRAVLPVWVQIIAPSLPPRASLSRWARPPRRRGSESESLGGSEQPGSRFLTGTAAAGGHCQWAPSPHTKQGKCFQLTRRTRGNSESCLRNCWRQCRGPQAAATQHLASPCRPRPPELSGRAEQRASRRDAAGAAAGPGCRPRQARGSESRPTLTDSKITESHCETEQSLWLWNLNHGSGGHSDWQSLWGDWHRDWY